MKKLGFGILLLVAGIVSFGQTTMTTSGNWSDPTVWSSGTVPINTSGTTAAPVEVSQPVTIDQNITISTGVYYFGYDGANTSTNATDQPGAPAYTLDVDGGTYSATASILDFKSGTVTFEGAATWAATNITIRAGATLILGGLTVNNKCVINVYGTLIINGNLIYSDSGSYPPYTMNVQTGGLVLIYGDFDANNGHVSVTGGGDLFTTGKIDNQGSSTVFGSNADCSTGPCSGRNLCGYTNSVSASQVLCSGTDTPSQIAGTTNAVNATITQWQTATSLSGFKAYGTTSSTDGCSGCDISGATSLTYTPTTVTTTTASTRYYRLYIHDANTNCDTYSFPIEVLTLGSGGWKGTTSNDWNTSGNWCGGVPGTATLVNIYPFPIGITGVFMPVIGTADASVNRLTIAGNQLGGTAASVTLNGGFSLNIYGTNGVAASSNYSFYNNGTFTSATTGTVNFLGSSSVQTQSIGGTSAVTFGNLTLNNTGTFFPGITVKDNNITVKGTLTMTSGKVNLNSYTVQIGSSAASTGTLSYASGWMYGGNIQRYVPASTAITVGSVAGEFPIGTTNDDRFMYFGIPSLTTGGWIKVSHTSATTTTTGLSIADGANTITNRQDSYWTVTTNGIATGSTFNLRADGYAGATGFGTIGAASDLRLMLSGSVTGTAGTNSGTNPFQVNRTGISLANLAKNWYWGSINATQTPLPVSFIDFTGKVINGQVELNWSTASESFNDHFTVYHSTDGERFIQIGKVNGHGTTNEKNDYSLADLAPAEGMNYYRLGQTDYDGKTSTLKTISVTVDKVYLTKIYPNPVDRNDPAHPLQVEMTGLPANQQLGVEVVNMQGISFHKNIVSADDAGTLSLSYTPGADVAAGMYILKVGNTRTRIVIK